MSPCCNRLYGVRRSLLATTLVLLPLASPAAALEDPPSFVFMWGSFGSGQGQLASPYGVAVNGGFVYVSDQGNYRVCKFTDSGELVTCWGSFGTGPGQFAG